MLTENRKNYHFKRESYEGERERWLGTLPSANGSVR